MALSLSVNTSAQTAENFAAGWEKEHISNKLPSDLRHTDRVVDWAAADIEKQYPPDAIFSGGKWIKIDKAIVKK